MGDLLQRASLLEKVRGAGNDLQPNRRFHLSHRLLGTTATGNDRIDAIRSSRRGDEGRATTRAGAEQANGQPARVVLGVEPAHRTYQAISQQSDVESKVAGVHVHLFLCWCQQIHQQRSQIPLSQLFGDVAIARRMSAAAASVSEHYQTLRTVGYCQVAVKGDSSSVDQNVPFSNIERMCLHRDHPAYEVSLGLRVSMFAWRQILEILSSSSTFPLPASRFPTNGCVLRASVPLFSRPRSVQKRAVVLPPSAHVWKVRCETPPSVLHASMPDAPMWRAFVIPFSYRQWQPFSFRAPLDALFFPKQPVFWADAFSLRRGELSRVRSQLPASSNGLRASLRGCDAFLPVRIHPPASTVTFLPAHPRAPVRSFQLLAFPSSRTDLIPAPVLNPSRAWVVASGSIAGKFNGGKTHASSES